MEKVGVKEIKNRAIKALSLLFTVARGVQTILCIRMGDTKT